MRSIRLGLIVSSALVVLSFGPAERRPGAQAAELDPLRIIDRGDLWARFDRPMVEPEGIGSPAPLEVDLPGSAAWTTVSTAVFTPSAPLSPSRTVTASIREVAALDGARLPAPVTWTFRTPGLEIYASIPSIAGPRPRFEIKFNYPVDPSSLAERTWFVSKERAIEARVSGCIVEPASSLPLDSAWTLTIDHLTATNGAYLESWSERFRVCPPPRLLRSEGFSDVAAMNRILLTFSNPMHEKELRRALTIRPRAEFSVACYGQEATLTGTFQAGTTYWLHLSEGVHDSYGNTMPALSATIGIPAYTPTLTLFEKGTYVEPRGPLAVPLYAVNVPEARVRVSRLPGSPWGYDGVDLSDTLLVANRQPNETFIHGVPLPGIGHYRVEASAPEVGLQTVDYYQVTDLALTFKLGRDRSLACVTSFETALPQSSVHLELCGDDGTVLWSGETDSEGRAWIPGRAALRDDPRYLVGRTGGDSAWIDVRRASLSTWRLPVLTGSPQAEDPIEIFLFTERPVYRPGETVGLKGWWKGRRDGKVKLELRGWRNELMESIVRPVSRTGGFDASFLLRDRMGSGTFAIDAVVDGGKVRHSFEVGCYRPSSFEVKARLDRPHFFPGERFEATVEARTYFGIPLSGAEVSWNAWIEERGERASGKAVLDAEGRARVSYSLGTQAGPLTLSATVTDSGNQSVNAHAWTRVLPSALEIVPKAKEALAVVGRPFEVEVAVKALDGSTLDRDVSARLLRQTWSHVQQRTAGHGWSYTWEKREDLVLTGFSSGGRWIFVPREPGPHVVEFRTSDPSDREAVATMEIDVIGPGEAAWRPRNDLLVELVPDRPQYRPGDLARVLVRNVPPGSRMLVSLEREGVSEARWMEAPTSTPVIEVPILREHLPNIHLGVLVLRGRTGAGPGPDGEDRGRPCFRYGYATLQVDASGERLPVEIKTVTDALPGSEVVVEISTSPRAEIALAVVDQAVLALLDVGDPDPHAAFHAPRPLLVRTAEARPDLLVRRPLDVRGKKGRPGGGGGGERSFRKNFKGTAYWNPSVEADENGRATVRFRLPDNLTRWRVVAVAAGDGRFGTAHATFETRKPVMIVSALPRFACLGDSFEARFVIHNRSGAAGRVHVEVDGEARDIEIADGASSPVVFPFKANVFGPRTFRATTRLGAFEDRLEVTVPVRFPAATESVHYSGRVSRAIDLSLPPLAHVESIELTMGRSSLVPMEGLLRKLLDYPYGCVEQTTSKTIPLLMCRDLGIEDIDQKIGAGVRRLLSMQTTSGGLAYWPGDDAPHPAGSVYATHALLLAKRQGFDVPQPALDAALRYVQGMLREGVGPWQTYALYVLALAGRRNEPYLHTLERDPFLALAAIEMGKPDLARKILSRLAPRRTGDVFHSAVREGCAIAIAKARLGDDPGIAARELLEKATLTYERAWALMALRERSGDSESAGRRARVFVEERLHSEWPLDRMVRLSLPAGRVRIEGDGALWYSLLVKGQRAEPAAEDRGFWVRRTYTRAGEPTPRLEFRAGDLVVVRLTVATGKERHYVAIEDPLPAGFEPVDLRFRTERRVGFDGDGFDHVESRDDRVFASEFSMQGVRELVYLARATTAGTFAAPAPRCEEMYSPEIWGRGPGATVTVVPR